jgi:crotonobetainyl-CoA:carnitine CoA-transferase CaiB-like acyl-CoA transferase
MNAHAAILRALYVRERTGQGAALAVSMFDSMADWMAAPLLIYECSGRVLPRTGLAHPLMAPYGAFTVGTGGVGGSGDGGGELLIAVQNEREWERLARDVLERPELLERPEFRGNTGRVAHREALEAEIAAVFATLSREALEARLRAHGIAYGAINTVAELSTHPALRRATIETAAGTLRVPAPPARMRGEPSEPPRALGAVPALGEHTAGIRAEFAE